MPNYRGVVIAGVDWRNISKSIKMGSVFFRSNSHKNQTQKSKTGVEIRPKLELITQLL